MKRKRKVIHLADLDLDSRSACKTKLGKRTLKTIVKDDVTCGFCKDAIRHRPQ